MKMEYMAEETDSSLTTTCKVFDSSEESGHLVLTIVISGHFFISQGQTLLEGFSLIGSKNWLKIVRRMDCLLFGTTIKNKSRMFRVQFSGSSREQALEHCYSCVQNLAQYITVQVPDGISQFRPSPGQGKGCVQSILPQYGWPVVFMIMFSQSPNCTLFHCRTQISSSGYQLAQAVRDEGPQWPG
ncbi:hypothetical protein MJG53_008119 [Ovis ammon polii x Ovis aries]|uniref:Uncharacterized protein n=1 Tax=Ovis ammon polii x Ovis aries TaxID=2918886 RepID=A0ACB9V0B4_9CETA|nr:hypothetical protein MJG53_008119 [Ovis ammon polii x Ovis aries]